LILMLSCVDQICAWNNVNRWRRCIHGSICFKRYPDSDLQHGLFNAGIRFDGPREPSHGYRISGLHGGQSVHLPVCQLGTYANPLSLSIHYLFYLNCGLNVGCAPAISSSHQPFCCCIVSFLLFPLVFVCPVSNATLYEIVRVLLLHCIHSGVFETHTRYGPVLSAILATVMWSCDSALNRCTTCSWLFTSCAVPFLIGSKFLNQCGAPTCMQPLSINLAVIFGVRLVVQNMIDLALPAIFNLEKFKAETQGIPVSDSRRTWLIAWSQRTFILFDAVLAQRVICCCCCCCCSWWFSSVTRRTAG
jgi:hypothetical protein